MDKESKDIVDSLVNLCWYMRGGLTIEQAYGITPEERELIIKMVGAHVESSKETGQVIL
jgi:hypothetical protein